MRSKEQILCTFEVTVESSDGPTSIKLTTSKTELVNPFAVMTLARRVHAGAEPIWTVEMGEILHKVGLSATLKYSTFYIVFMAFGEDLDPSISWDHVRDNTVRMIYGKGQMVYWKGSNVTHYEKDKHGNDVITELRGKPDGQGQLKETMRLYITDGQVQEK